MEISFFIVEKEFESCYIVLINNIEVFLLIYGWYCLNFYLFVCICITIWKLKRIKVGYD